MATHSAQATGLLDHAVNYFTGIRSSEPRLTLGNYIGAVLPILEAQRRCDPAGPERERPLVFVADLHGFTDQPVALIEQSRVETIYTYLALGLDPARCDVYVQSQIMFETLRTMLLLARHLTISQLSRCPTLKDKVADPDRASVALAQYPLLMSADIILQRPRFVPTGKDQRAHLEIARDIVGRINHEAGRPLLPMPEGMTAEPPNILALHGDGKMSKTSPENAAIFLDDTPENAREKIQRAQSGIEGKEALPDFEWGGAGHAAERESSPTAPAGSRLPLLPSFLTNNEHSLLLNLLGNFRFIDFAHSSDELISVSFLKRSNPRPSAEACRALFGALIRRFFNVWISPQLADLEQFAIHQLREIVQGVLLVLLWCN